jgi:hypothetical protein
MSIFDELREFSELQWLYFQKFSSFDRTIGELPSLPQNGATIPDLARLGSDMKEYRRIGELIHQVATKPANELFDLSIGMRIFLGNKARMNLLQLCPASEAEFREGVETLTGAIKEKLGLFQEN